jgi:hypothetical protein
MTDCQVQHDKIKLNFENIITSVYDRYYRYYDVNNIIARSNALEDSKEKRDVFRRIGQEHGSYRTSKQEELKIDDLYKKSFRYTPQPKWQFR